MQQVLPKNVGMIERPLQISSIQGFSLQETSGSGRRGFRIFQDPWILGIPWIPGGARDPSRPPPHGVGVRGEGGRGEGGIAPEPGLVQGIGGGGSDRQWPWGPGTRAVPPRVRGEGRGGEGGGGIAPEPGLVQGFVTMGTRDPCRPPHGVGVRGERGEGERGESGEVLLCTIVTKSAKRYIGQDIAASVSHPQ